MKAHAQSTIGTRGATLILAALLNLAAWGCQDGGPLDLTTHESTGDILKAAKGGKGGGPPSSAAGTALFPSPPNLAVNGLYGVSGGTFPATIGSSGIVVTPNCSDKLRLVLVEHAFDPAFVTECDGNRFSIDITLAELRDLPNGGSAVAGSPFGSNTNFSDNSYYYFLEDVDGDGRFRFNRGDIGWNLVWDQGVTVTRTAGVSGDPGGVWTIATTAAQEEAALLVPRGGSPAGQFSVPLAVTLTITG